MDGVQLPQGESHFEEAVQFLPLSSQKFLVRKAESTLESTRGLDLETPGLGIQPINRWAKSS